MNPSHAHAPALQGACRDHSAHRRIFFLLATFVLFTLSLNRIQSLPVPLPFTGEKGKEEPVTIQVTDGGAACWNRDLIEVAEIPARLAHYKTQTDTPRVVVTGDERARFGPMVMVLDQVRQAGLTHFSAENQAAADREMGRA